MKKKGQAADADVAMSGGDTEILMASYDNTSQDKSWIFDSDSSVHVCSHKKLLNSLVAKEERTVKMVDGACEIIDTGSVKVTERDGTMYALEAIKYVPKVRYNLIYIGVLDEEGCRIQMQQDVITINQGDK